MSKFFFFLQFFILFSISFAFFDFLKTKTNKIPVNKESFDLKFLGIHPSNLPYYKESSTFFCDNNTKELTLDQLNDDYCDCLDGIDEPGTSACSYINQNPDKDTVFSSSNFKYSSTINKSLFYCENKGYNPAFLNTNKVNDGYCDCCDGSDEVNSQTVCYNTCKEKFEENKNKNLNKLNNFLSAYAINKNYYNTQYNLYQNNENLIKLIENDIKIKDEIQIESERLLNSIKEKIKSSYLPTIELNKLDFNKMLLLNINNVEHYVPYLVNLMKLFNIEEYTLSRYFDYDINDHTNENENNIHEMNFNDEELDEERFLQEGHDEYNQEEVEIYLNENDINNNIIKEEDDQNKEENNKCKAFKHLNNLSSEDYNLIKSLCNSSNLLLELENVINKIIVSRNDFYLVLTLLELFTKNNYTWQYNYHELVNEIKKINEEKNNNNYKLCPFTYRDLEFTSCLNESILDDLKNNIKFEDKYYYLNDEYNKINAENNENLKVVNELQKKKYSMIDQFKLFNENNLNLLPILSIKDQCFPKNDGKFLYNFCIMKEITQKESTGNHNLVSLGTFSSFSIHSNDINEELIDEHSSSTTPYYFELNYTDGQMCWGHGRRVATVHVLCGKDNELVEVREPSVCSYYLKFYSPIACNLDYAEKNYLTQYLSEKDKEL